MIAMGQIVTSQIEIKAVLLVAFLFATDKSLDGVDGAGHSYLNFTHKKRLNIIHWCEVGYFTSAGQFHPTQHSTTNRKKPGIDFLISTWNKTCRLNEQLLGHRECAQDVGK